MQNDEKTGPTNLLSGWSVTRREMFKFSPDIIIDTCRRLLIKSFSEGTGSPTTSLSLISLPALKMTAMILSSEGRFVSLIGTFRLGSETQKS